MSIQTIYGWNSIDIDIPYAFQMIVVPKNPLKRICIQSIVFWPNIWAQTSMSFSDSITGVVIGILNIPAQPPQIGDGSNGIQVHLAPTGTKLNVGAGLNLTLTPFNGASGRLHLETYQKGPIYAVVPYQTPMTAGCGV